MIADSVLKNISDALHGLDERITALEAAQLPEIERLQAAGVDPGDTIIATVPEEMLVEDLLQLQETLKAKFPGHEIIVLAGGIELTAARRKESVDERLAGLQAVSDHWQRIVEEDT